MNFRPLLRLSCALLLATAQSAFAWSAHARAHAETAYCAGIANADLIFDPLLLRAFEVEKECHEMIYASTVLPEWSYAPELTFGRLLDGLARA